ncbi:MAG TPA: acyl-CoA dehydrogenase family protein [Burkholderiales bacterium]|nr:acyl-CoA dehydrogenase family protein [Burkholderiales bacterium]
MNLVPTAREIALRQRARSFFAKAGDAGSWQAFCREGLLDASITSAATPPLRDSADLAILLEELGRSLSRLPLASNVAAVITLARFGAPAASHLFNALAGGEASICIAVHGCDDAWIGNHVGLVGYHEAGTWRLRGDACWVEGFESSTYCLVAFAASGDEAQLALGVVRTDAPHIRCTTATSADGEPLCFLEFDDVELPDSHVLVSGPKATEALRHVKAMMAACHAAQMVGAADFVTETALDHCNQRQAFGAPLAALPVVRQQCAEMRIAIDAAWLLTAEAFWRLARDEPFAVQASQAKAFANERCLMVCRIGQQLHGASAFMQGHPVHSRYRHVASLSVRSGTAAEHRAFVASALLDCWRMS